MDIKKQKGDANVFMIGLFLTFLTVFIFFLTIRINQINITYDEMDEALSLSVLSSAVMNREDEYATQQTVIHELDEFTGGITADSDLRILGNTDDAYLKNAYDCFLLTFTDNFRLNEDLIPANSIVNTKIDIVEYSIYNIWHELDSDGYRTGNFRVCRYDYDPKIDVWNSTWYPLNQKVTVPDSLSKRNISVEFCTVSAQIKVTVTKLPYVAKIFEEDSGLTQDVYYARVADIKENEDNIKKRDEGHSMDTEGESIITNQENSNTEQIIDGHENTIDIEDTEPKKEVMENGE